MNFFEITKYNAHTVIIKKETVDLHCLIAQVIDEIYPTLSANGNTAVFTAEDNLSVNADPEKLARVFSNLCGTPRHTATHRQRLLYRPNG